VEALRVATEIARGLAHAHHAGVVHRDLKPSNVFLCDDGAVKILDFGLSRVFGSGSGPEGGTPAYMAPEQWRRDAEDERADVFALGVMLHEMLSGQRPFAVESGRSTALDDGPPPELPASSAPRPVRALVRRALSRSRDERPRDGTAILEALLEQRSAEEAKGGRRRVVLAGALVGLVALLALLATRALRDRDLAPGERIPVAVADFQNGTSDPELNGLSGMLTTALEQSRRLTVLTRSRLADLIRQTGKEVPERIDESLAREVGKAAGVKALLLATVHRFDDVYAIEMRALDPATNEYLFTLREDGKGKASVPGMIDRLSARTRERLRERPDAASPSRKVAEVTTGNLAAYEHYFKARQAMDLRQFERARDELQAAIRIDPEFALAHYQTAVLDAWTVKPGFSAEASVRGAQEHLDRAVALSGRLPDKERMALLAWKATWEKHPEEARRLRDEAALAYPQDKEAVFWAGDIRFHFGDTVAAVPYFERALVLDPEYALVEEHLAMAYAALDRREDLLRLSRAWAAHAHDPESFRTLGRALVALDRREEAVEVYEKARAQDGLLAAPPALAGHLAFHGRAHEAEEQIRRALAALPPPQEGEVLPTHGPSVLGERIGYTRSLVELLVYQGRFREARQVAAFAVAAGVPARDAASIQLNLAFATQARQDAEAAFATMKKAGLAENPEYRYDVAIVLALTGDPAAAEARAPEVFAGSTAAEFPDFMRPLFDGIVAWKKGDLDAAAKHLQVVAASPYVDARYKALSLLGQVEAARGRDTAALEALERARAIPYAPWVGGMSF
ncbi:MAG: protein kinase, partial [Anaeromyxobacteraceae bacterium]